MNCQEFWSAMPELNGEPDAEARAHQAECPGCAELLRRQTVLAAGLRSAAAGWRRAQAPGRLEPKLLAAFRGQAGLAAPNRARHWWMPIASWSAAAAVLAAAGLLFAIYERQPSALVAAPVSELSAIDWTAALALDDDPNDAGNEFIPLPNANRLPPAEHVNLVRVEVPRSAMIALGYSVQAERAAERVQADVVLGSDGLARAVRFLDE